MLMIIVTLVLLGQMYKTCTGWFLTDEQVLRSLSSARLDDTTSVSNYIDMSEPCLFMRIRHLTVVLWLRYIAIKSVQYESRSHSWSKNRYFAWECWTSLRRDWSNWKVSKLKDPIQNMSYIVPKQNKDFLHDRVALVSGRTLLSEGSEFLSFLQLITAGRTSATCVKVQLRWISSRTQTWTKGYRRGHRLDMEIVKRI